MTLMNPDGTLDTWYLKRGDMHFIPRAYPHHIEVLAATFNVHLPNFPFTQADPLIVNRINPVVPPE